MTGLEALLIIILACVAIVLLYSYLENDRKLNFSRVRSDASNLGGRVYGEASNLGGKIQGGASDLGEKVSGEGSMSGMGEKIKGSGVSEKVSGVGESISGIGQKFKGKVSDTVSRDDDLFDQIDQFLKEKSDQLIKDWELVTKNDLGNLEKRFSTVANDVSELDKRVNNIEERLEKLENPEKITYNPKISNKKI
jgi:hypothetical protein